MYKNCNTQFSTGFSYAPLRICTPFVIENGGQQGECVHTDDVEKWQAESLWFYLRQVLFLSPLCEPE
ncbi:hypothetical protein [Endozoicomonas sp. SESOKO3]|uniref:hypothetical protein n=1 Tax=Endozoicomonas sp. SESOKO3 TaxID=2828744 RepID=UPI0021480605|nr:hypothetical protein [Endozoicomonas sp. SESOKO3]